VRSAVHATRETGGGALVENVHRVHVAVVTPRGHLLASEGDPSRIVFARSSAKPLQAIALAGHLGADLSPPELALACASHAGGAWATEPIAAWLARLGLGPDDLCCGAHPPSDKAAIEALGASPPSPLHHNCSGKHCGMLALARLLGAPTRDYLRLAHPVQRAIRAEVERLVGPAEIAWAVDGCSAPTPAMQLQALALGYARFSEAASLTPDLERSPLLAIWRAMRDHAELVAGPGLLDTAVMRAVVDVVVKRGADGVEGGALISRAHGPLGFALKVEDGSNEARDVALVALLDLLGALNPAARHALAAFVRPPRKNARGLVVGHLTPHLELNWS
jgi:L-asparaginase II